MVGTPIRGGLGGGWDNLTLFFSGTVLSSSALFSKFSLLFSVFLCIPRGSWERSGMWGAGLFGLLSASIPITLDKIFYSFPRFSYSAYSMISYSIISFTVSAFLRISA